MICPVWLLEENFGERGFEKFAQNHKYISQKYK